MPEMRASQILWDAAVVGDVNSGGSKATGTLVSTGTDNDIYVVSKLTGTDGNDIEIKTVHNTAESIAVVGHVITIQLNSGTSSANSIITLIEGNGTANGLVTVALTADSSGAGHISDSLDLTLTGGVNSVASNAGEIGPMSNVAVFIQVDGACSFQVEASAYKGLTSGRNGISDALPWYEYVRGVALEIANGVDAGYSTIVFADAATVAVDVSPFAPQFIRLTRIDDLNTDITITAYTVAVG